MDELEAAARPEPMPAGSMHLRHEVHEHDRVDAHDQQEKNQHHHAHHRADAEERLPHGGRRMGGWSVRHGAGIPSFVRIHICPGGLR